MRRALVCGAIGLLLTACGSQAGSGHHAYVVVQHLTGSWFDRRVDFTGDQIDAVTAMNRSGIEYSTQQVSSGKVVCQVDNEPSTYAVCFPPNKPYWALFVMSAGRWTNGSGGVSDVVLRDGEAIGWHYVPSGTSSPAPPPSPH